ncbi:glycoside hydrolase family 3 C-terminal domain-containing protein [Yinghuangia seranimata]|uniref:glycoside hydrolase family 3 C-terminal domain-containing protein n=1 Tax=Yinghuangia seranimata TaxID=408067 RepID=UPI00248C6F44|nr:glycoside hydrolase family 3 C-terminal domain-containing protein [Yinghuangia seranimata]MDI2129414.1 glycoside hydrolase family 3 C-terminal domain-containing protein [Yinghuangia seranimata]
MPDVTPDSLSLDEKASLLTGRDFSTTNPVETAGVPSIVLVDGPHGVRPPDAAADHLGINASLPATCFPPAVAVGSSWDPDVAARVGAAVAHEARSYGIHVVLGPGVNIKRSPLCGRNFEYYSEDPLLSGVLATAHVQAMQSESVGASVKHFAANNQEHERMRISADVDERALREIYLPAFERVVTEAQPATVMCSYNRINGVPASENHWLLTEVLREEWGFDGLVVSDWGAVGDRVAALAAGLDLAMPADDGTGTVKIVEAVRSGELGEDVVDRSVARVLALSGLVADATNGLKDKEEEHHALARELAAECVVLLRNEGGALPLSPDARIAVIGEFAAAPRFQGGGSSHINTTRTTAAVDAIRALAADEGNAVSYARGYALDASADAQALLAEAASAARAADVAVVFAGLDERDESEGYDRETLDLPAAQVEVIRAVAAAAARTVVVLSNGGVVSLEGWHDEVDAIVEGWLLGQAGGGAIADVLFGAANPSGHLAETIPMRLQDNPSYLNFPGENGHVRYGEGVMVGYRHYNSVELPVRYPFGHGLSYTTFETREVTATLTGDDTATASVTVANTGSRAGKHVVQVYVATTAGPVRRPTRELRAFTKVALAPGESRTVELALDRRAFAYYDIVQGGWTVAGGDYRIQVGRNAVDIAAETSLTLAGDAIVRPLSLDSTVNDWFSHPVVGPELMGRLAQGMPEQSPEEAEENARMMRMVDSMPMRQFVGFIAHIVTTEHLEALIGLSHEG